MNKKRALSGIKPTGDIHLGNYFGAFREFLALQNNQNIENLYFIADYHALNEIPDPKLLRERTIHIFKAFIALGLDPEKSVIFVQSDVPEHTELCWLLSGVTPMGLLERSHAYKDSVAKQKIVNMGLFNYPLLQAADILIYDADLVPVGADQKQHVEIARDIAEKFNREYGDIFTIPEPLIQNSSAIVPGTDGQKMSKSKNNTIPIFASEKEIKKSIMNITTDSTPLENPKDPNNCTIFLLYKMFASPTQIEKMKQNYLNGGYGYGHAKTELFEIIMQHFEPVRKKMLELNSCPGEVFDLMKTGAEKARIIAQSKIDKVKKTMGLG